MRCPVALFKRKRTLILPRIAIMNGGRVVPGFYTHGVKFHTRGRHFYFCDVRKRWVQWSYKNSRRCHGCNAIVSNDLIERDLCQRCRL